MTLHALNPVVAATLIQRKQVAGKIVIKARFNIM